MQHPLVQLYGSDAFNLVASEIEEVRRNSNFTFDKKYLELSVSFLNMKALSLVEKKEQRSLKSLVSESFGEAAIAKFNGNLI